MAFRAGIVVFSRYDSRRLPGKALRPIAGRPMLGLVLDRVRQVRDVPVVVATSDRPVDDAIAAAAGRENIAVFRGAVDDVAGRALACAEHFDFELVVRISGDSPFIPPEVIAALLHHPGMAPDALVTNVFPRSFPPGASVEVIGRQLLQQLMALPLDAEDREHVTRYVYRHPHQFRIANHSAPDRRYEGVSLVVDETEDLARAEQIIAALGQPSHLASLDAVVACARRLAGEGSTPGALAAAG